MKDYTIVHDEYGTHVRYTIETVGECTFDLYVQGELPPNYPVPAIRNVLWLVAAVSCDAATDFLDIGSCGTID